MRTQKNGPKKGQKSGLSLVVVMIISTAMPVFAEQSTLLHVPPSSWTAGEPLEIAARISADWTVSRVWVGYRPSGTSGEYTEIDMLRAPDNRFVAVIGASDVQPPGLEYFLSSEDVGGVHNNHFASAQSPYAVSVLGETDEMRLAQRLERHNGNRSTLEAWGRFAQYGRREVDRSDSPIVADRAITEGGDRFWLTELEYTYRFLGMLYDIHFGLGVMRGVPATLVIDGESRPLNPSENGDPGLNYGYGGITLEFTRLLSMEADLTFGASEEGFAAGVGGLFRFGRIAGTRLEVGGELIGHAGSSAFFRFAWTTVPRFPMALAVELSDWPNHDVNPMATRLIYSIAWEANDRLTIGAEGGYGARTDGVEGGPLLGLGAAVSF